MSILVVEIKKLLKKKRKKKRKLPERNLKSCEV